MSWLWIKLISISNVKGVKKCVDISSYIKQNEKLRIEHYFSHEHRKSNKIILLRLEK